jgi:hypothetical protein
VLSIVDKDHDGKVSQAELEAAGLAALPSFAGTEGHHYDVESGEFLTSAISFSDHFRAD